MGQAYYYSSDEAHLRAAVGGLSDVIILEWGDTVKFACDCKPQFCAGFCPSFDDWQIGGLEKYVSGKSVRIGDIGDEWRELYASRETSANPGKSIAVNMILLIRAYSEADRLRPTV